MNKLSGKTALSRRKKKADSEEIQPEAEKKITTVATRRNVTTNTTPVPMRLTENDKADLNLWLSELSEETGKKITNAKLLRGLIRLRGKINQKSLIKAINEAS